jgi:hypothetical protein
MGFWFLICLFVALVGTALLIGFGLEGQVRNRLVEYGIRTRAEVVRAYSEDSEDLSVHFAYRDHRGEPQSGYDTVSGRLFSGRAKGSQIEIRFDPQSPSRSRIEATLRAGWWHEPLAGAGMGLGAATIGWGAILLAVWRAWRRVRFLKNGARTVGKVLEVVVDQRRRLSGLRPGYLRYAFEGPDGRSRTGRSDYLPLTLEGRFEAGGSVVVVYDFAQPDRHAADIFAVDGGAAERE